jgi:hypothetical protein
MSDSPSTAINIDIGGRSSQVSTAPVSHANAPPSSNTTTPTIRNSPASATAMLTSGTVVCVLVRSSLLMFASASPRPQDYLSSR